MKIEVDPINFKLMSLDEMIRYSLITDKDFIKKLNEYVNLKKEEAYDEGYQNALRDSHD